MKSVLVVYGTTEGQSRKVAEFIADALKARGVEVELVDSAAAGATQVQPVYAAVIVCGSLHLHSYQASLVRFVKRNMRENCGNSRRRSIGQPAGRRPSLGTWLVRSGTRTGQVSTMGTVLNVPCANRR
jgi:hypothetical protein